MEKKIITVYLRPFNRFYIHTMTKYHIKIIKKEKSYIFRNIIPLVLIPQLVYYHGYVKFAV